MKKNNTTEKSIIKADKISKALKENTEKTLRALVNETINNLILEEEETPEVEDDENDYEVEDVNVENDSETTDTPEAEEAEVEEAPEEGEDDEWSEYDDFKTDDNDYDITDQDEEGVEILRKMYDMLEDGDELIVTKNENDELVISNEETGDEEVVNMSDEESVELPGEESEDEFELELDDDDSEDEMPEDEIEIDIEDDNDEEDEPTYEFDIDEEELTESLGYTDSYQSKTAMTTPPNKEVADPKATNSWDKVPTGDGKRWAGKGNNKPFGEKSCCEAEKSCCESEEMVEEPIEEATNVGGAVQQRSSSKSHIPAGRKEYVPKGTRHASFADKYEEIVESYKKMKAENDTLKESLKATKKSLVEAAILNVNLGKVVNLLVNETTTRDEKKSILSRFNEVKTISEGTTLFNNIKRELNETKKSAITLDKSIVAESKNNLNETTFYQDRSKNPSLALMDRLDNLWKK